MRQTIALRDRIDHEIHAVTGIRHSRGARRAGHARALPGRRGGSSITAGRRAGLADRPRESAPRARATKARRGAAPGGMTLRARQSWSAGLRSGTGCNPRSLLCPSASR
jgi:hypothetical protein